MFVLGSDLIQKTAQLRNVVGLIRNIIKIVHEMCIRDSYILLYHYPNGTNYKGNASGQVFLIEDSQTIEQICQTLSKTNAECTTSRPDITGYDISDYKTEFSLELHSNKSTQIWNSLVGVENYLLRWV